MGDNQGLEGHPSRRDHLASDLCPVGSCPVAGSGSCAGSAGCAAGGQGRAGGWSGSVDKLPHKPADGTVPKPWQRPECNADSIQGVEEGSTQTGRDPTARSVDDHGTSVSCGDPDQNDQFLLDSDVRTVNRHGDAAGSAGSSPSYQSRLSQSDVSTDTYGPSSGGTSPHKACSRADCRLCLSRSDLAVIQKAGARFLGDLAPHLDQDRNSAYRPEYKLSECVDENRFSAEPALGENTRETFERRLPFGSGCGSGGRGEVPSSPLQDYNSTDYTATDLESDWLSGQPTSGRVLDVTRHPRTSSVMPLAHVHRSIPYSPSGCTLSPSLCETLQRFENLRRQSERRFELPVTPSRYPGQPHDETDPARQAESWPASRDRFDILRTNCTGDRMTQLCIGDLPDYRLDAVSSLAPLRASDGTPDRQDQLVIKVNMNPAPVNLPSNRQPELSIRTLLADKRHSVLPILETLPRTLPPPPTTEPPPLPKGGTPTPRTTLGRARMRSRAARRKRMALSLDLSLVLDVVLKDSHSTPLTTDSEEDGLRPPALLEPKVTLTDETTPSASSSGRSLYSRPQSLHDYDLKQDDISLVKAELKVISKEPELLPDGQKRYRMMSHSPTDLAKSSLAKDLPPSLLPPIGHDYDRIKAECDRMNNELQSLEKKYDQAVKASNMYHQQYKVTKDKLDQLSSDVDAMKAENRSLVEDKSRLQSEVERLTQLRVEDKTELDDLRRQQREVMSESGSFEGFSTIYDQAVSRYEALKLEYDGLRKQYTDTVASLNSMTNKDDHLQEENDRLRKQLEQLKQEKNSAHQDRKILQQHVTLAIQAANREKNDLMRELSSMKSERDSCRKKASGLETQLIQISKDTSRLKKERDAAVHEYSLVMSERDSVHKEMEQLQDKLTAVQKKYDLAEKENKSLKDKLDSVQREASAVLEQRDRTLKQLNELKDKYGERHMDPLDQEFMHLDRFIPERSSGRREQNQDNKEIESLRKEVERLQAELRDVQQEKEDSKRRCDWAFTERDKIVRERESIRTLCDKLRHERDSAVSKLIEALRDTDELKKQKSDALKQLKEVKERYETLIEKEVRKGQLHNLGHNHSHDSAIDADLQEWETETLQLELGGVSVKDLGIDLVGGVEDPQYPDNAVFVANIKQDSCALGKLKINDQLIKVNNLDVTNVEKSVVYQALNSGEGTVHVMVRRRRLVSTRSVVPIHINLTDGELGAQLESGIFVSRIILGSACAREGNLAVGDRVVSVNGHSVENMTPDEVCRFALSHGDHVTFNIIKYSFTPNSSVMLSSSPSSGHNLTESSPDGLSLSPRSPQLHHCSWTAPSPDSSNKTSLSLKCSGSQTDSLDSPQPSLRSGWSDQDKLPHRQYVSNRTPEYELGSKKDSSQEICYPSQISAGIDYSRSHHVDGIRHREHELHRSHDSEQRTRSHDVQDSRRSREMTNQRPFSQLGQNQRSSMQSQNHGENEKKTFIDKALNHFQKKSHNVDRKIRDNRCKSGHPFFNIGGGHTTEEQVIEELNAMINQYENPVGTGITKTSDKSQSKKHPQENGGTWPKCRSNLDPSKPVWVPASVIKERPPVTDMFQESSHTQSSYQHQDGKLPPMPPERNDSFKRSASIKHSPQNSDPSKYTHYSISSPSKSSHQTTYYTSPGSSTSHATSQSSALEEKKGSSHLENSWNSASPQEYNKDSSSALYSPHSSANSSTQDSLDYSVKSANNQQDMSRYVRKPNRPTSAPNQSRSAKMKARAEERRRELQENHGHRSHSRSKQLQEIAEMLSHDAQISPQDYIPQKPKSLDIQPMYSPRPLPHSGHNITPNSAVPPSGYLSSKQNHHLPSSGSGPLSPRDKPVVLTGQLKSPHSYPSSVPAPTQILRSTNVFHLASSQMVTSPGSGSTHPSTPSPMSSQPLGPRYGSPTGHYMRGSGSSILNSSIPEVESENMGVYHVGRDRFSTPSPSPSQQSSSFDHSATVSDEFPYEYVHQRPVQGRHSHHVPSMEGSSTFPNQRAGLHPERFRIPSNQSMVSSHRSATSSVERVSGHSSPVSPSYIPGLSDYLHLPPGTSHSLPKAAADTKHRTRPHLGETRNIKFEKSIEPLGIQIESGSLGGIFVSSVSDNSLANKAGINVGDQLLEVCGINMRNATKDLAARVLQQCGGSINMLVQYNPDKYQEETDGSSGRCSESSTANTPDISCDHKGNTHRVSDETLTSDTVSPHTHSPTSLSPLHSSVKSGDCYPPMEPRFVMLKKVHPHDSLGVTLVGGNAVGIFVRSVQPNGVSGGPKGLRYGDQILEYNGINFRSVTHEQAAIEIAKPAETVSILAQYNIQRLNKILDQPGDAFYIRALFDHQAESEDQLGFNRNDILFVDNTLYNGMPGVWRAWIVDDSGNKLQCGTIPSKSRLEDELSLRRSQSEVGEDELSKSSRRGSASARRSFFRKKKHQRSNSRDSRELNSFSDASINSDSVPFLDDSSLMSYERVERLDSKVCRPVLILAPLAEPLINKLTSESPDKYCRCEPDIIKATISSLETGQNDGLFVDFRPRADGQFECITVQSVREIISKNRHCLLNVHPDAIEHLHKVNIYPIVLFIKHKSSKEIREVKDTRFLPEKLSNKSVKELHETFQKYEQKYKRLFTETLSGGNLAYMCRVIKSSIDQQQQKTLWVPSGSL